MFLAFLGDYFRCEFGGSEYCTESFSFRKRILGGFLSNMTRRYGIDSTGSGLGPTTVFCYYGNEFSGFLTRNVLENRSEY